jgi:hypothetical protein
MGIVMTVPCRSYSAQAFDGCPACLDAALDAATQAGLYLLGRAAPSLWGGPEGRIEMSYRLSIRLYDDSGGELATDVMSADQSVEGVLELADREDTGHGISDPAEPETSMRLDDFQTTIDSLELAPAGPNGACGAIVGNLFGFGQLVCRFAIDIAPGIAPES